MDKAINAGENVLLLTAGSAFTDNLAELQGRRANLNSNTSMTTRRRAPGIAATQENDDIVQDQLLRGADADVLCFIIHRTCAIHGTSDLQTLIGNRDLNVCVVSTLTADVLA